MMKVTNNTSSKPLIIKSLPSKIGGGIDNIFTIASSPVRLRGKKSGFEKRTEYVDTLEKFRYGEKVAGTIAGFSLSLAGNVQYAFVDLGDGRHTRVHLRSFQAAGLNPKNLSVGDSLQLKKLCYIGKYHVTKWRIQQAPVGAHCQEAVRHLPSLAAAMESHHTGTGPMCSEYKFIQEGFKDSPAPYSRAHGDCIPVIEK